MKRLLKCSMYCLVIGSSVLVIGCNDSEETTHPSTGGGGNYGRVGGGSAAIAGSGAKPAIGIGGNTAPAAGAGGSAAAAGVTQAVTGSAAGGGQTASLGGAVVAAGGPGVAATAGSGALAGTGVTPSAGGAVAGGGASTVPAGGSSTNPGSPGAAGRMACQLMPQSGCPAGQACDLDLSTPGQLGSACRPGAGEGTDTDLCSTLTDCHVGYTCVGNGKSKSCMKLCASDNDCKAPGGLCVVELTDSQATPGAITGAKVCSQNCEPMTSAGCPNGWGCGLYSALDGRTFSKCHSVSVAGPVGTAGAAGATGSTSTAAAGTAGGTGAPGTEGASCADDWGCAPGYACVTFTRTVGATSTTVQQCFRYCFLSAPACPTGSTCDQLSSPAVLGSASYGICG